MPRFGVNSTQRLATCRPELIEIAEIVIVNFDFSVVWGHRGERPQNDAYDQGFSKVRWPNSKHNKTPSWAYDLVPYPIDWDDRDRFILLAGRVLQVAATFDIPLLWGGDWNQNDIIKDERFQDLAHFQLKGG